MLRVKSAFHVTHMVKDLDAATRLYQEIFQPPIHFDGYHEGENRDASFASVSDAYIELFAPRDVNEPAPTSNGGRYIRRWGEGLANFGWLIEDDVPEAIRFCESRGYQLVYVAGPAPYAFFIHPKQAHGLMLEVARSTIPADPRTQPGWAARWRDEHPLGIERLNAVSYAVRDLEGPIQLLQSLTNAPIVHRGADQAAGKESAYLWITDHVIEVMQPASADSEIARFIEERGPRIHSVTFKVKDLDRAAAYLRQKGLGLLDTPAPRSFTINPADLLGARYSFTDRAIPNDPRDA
ncbi:MAG TPA: VOC family protein [Dehalococcoidia bacterium]|nr:VOC family protein [Dehalococcoidia bacterium]